MRNKLLFYVAPLLLFFLLFLVLVLNRWQKKTFNLFLNKSYYFFRGLCRLWQKKEKH